MRTIIWLFLVITVASCELLPSYATDNPTQTWNLPRNILRTQNQLSFNQGAAAVWYFMEAASQLHDPLTYRLLPDYTAPCDNWHSVVGISRWESTNVATTGEHIAFVSLNFTDHALPVNNVVFQARR